MRSEPSGALLRCLAVQVGVTSSRRGISRRISAREIFRLSLHRKDYSFSEFVLIIWNSDGNHVITTGNHVLNGVDLKCGMAWSSSFEIRSLLILLVESTRRTDSVPPLFFRCKLRSAFCRGCDRE